MKIRNWIYLGLTVLCIAGFIGYVTWDSLRTDTTAPTITFGTELPELQIADGESMLLADVTAHDDVDGDVTASVLVENVRLVDEQGLVSVTYAAFDRAGNVVKATRQVRYTDYHSPRFSLSVPLLFSSNFSLLQYISASDVLDGDISDHIRATALTEGSITQVGTHSVLLRVTNSLGDTAELTVPVEVGTYTSRSATLELTDYLIYLPVGTAFEAESYLRSFSVGNAYTALYGHVPEDCTLQTTGNVDIMTPGVYTVTYELTQTSELAIGISRLIVVVEE